VTRRSDERGIALILAVFALVVIAALISAVFFTAQLEERSGSNTMASLQASEAAQAGLEWAAANWSESWAQAGVGKTTAVGWSQLGATPGYFTDSVTELNAQLVLVRAFGQSRNAAGNVVASRSAGMLFKAAPPDFNLSAALTVAGSMALVGTPVVSGTDATPPAGKWSTLCAGYPLSNVQAIRNDGSYSIAGTVTPSYTQNDTSATTSAAKMAAAFYTLSGMADISTTDYSPSLAPVLKPGGHQCNTGGGHPDNWGDPTGTAPGDGSYPCATYFPLIYYHGCCAISIYDPGQGVLLVDRTDLSLWGSFYGLILVHSGQVTVHAGGAVYGMIVGDAGSRIRGTVKYSSCAVKLATAGIKLGQPLASRASIRY
jgi:hypothetical protein